MENAVKRIVYCESEFLSAIPADKAEVLDKELPVRAVPDDVLLKMRRRYSLLYFSRDDYDQAIRKLTTEQVHEVVVTRRETWSPDAAGHSIAWFEGKLRKCLSLTALALKQSRQPGTTTLLQQNFEHTIKRLAALRGSPPLGILMPPEVFEIALQGEARLSMECADLPVPDGPRLAERRSRRAGTIAQIMARLDDDAFLEGLPFMVRKRGVNVFPLHLMIREDPELEEEGGLLTDWGGGTVIPWPHHELENLVGPGLEQEDVARHVLYLDAEQYETFAATATRAQRERDFGERLAAAKAPDAVGISDSAADHVNGLAADQLAYLWSLRDLFAAMGRSDLAPELEPLIREDITSLREVLKECPSWVSTSGDGTGNAMGSLVAVERQIQQSAEFFMRLAHDSRWVDFHSDYRRILAVGSKLQELTDAHGRT